MALIKCPDCGFESVSTSAPACRVCGCTDFYKKTGKTIIGKCFRCMGEGKNNIDFTRGKTIYTECTTCWGKKKVKYFQKINLKTNKIEWWFREPWGTETFVFHNKKISSWL